MVEEEEEEEKGGRDCNMEAASETLSGRNCLLAGGGGTKDINYSAGVGSSGGWGRPGPAATASVLRASVFFLVFFFCLFQL